MVVCFKKLVPVFAVVLAVMLAAGIRPALAADISRFVGEYAGSAEVALADGTKQTRDMSVRILSTKKGFAVKWTSTRHREDGRIKAKSYEIRFGASDRDGVYAAAMGKNVFGHDVQLDPMRGEPFVWARLIGDTLSIYSLFVTDAGGYEIQQYDRTLVDEGLLLNFKTTVDGVQMREVTTVLKRQ